MSKRLDIECLQEVELNFEMVEFYFIFICKIHIYLFSTIANFGSLLNEQVKG